MAINISKAAFYSILLLILLLPVWSKAKLFLYGIRTEGVVVDHQMPSSRVHSGRPYTAPLHAVVQFETDNRVIQIFGAGNVKYKMGEKVKLVYDKSDPYNCRIFNFYHIYSGFTTAFAVILAIFWGGFYRVFNGYRPDKNG